MLLSPNKQTGKSIAQVANKTVPNFGVDSPESCSTTYMEVTLVQENLTRGSVRF